METPKEATNERGGKGDEKPWVACVVKDVSAQWQLSEGESAGSSYSAVAAERQRRQQRQRHHKRKQRSKFCIGFMSLRADD